MGSHVEVLRNIPVNFDVRSVMLGGDWPQMYVHTGFYTCTGSVVFVCSCLHQVSVSNPVPGTSSRPWGQR